MSLRFAKYEGLGNDFVIVEGPRAPFDAERTRQLCDRHFGVGADGVLVTGLVAGRPFMTVTNADGSSTEMCGNGLRCVVRYLVDRGMVPRGTVEDGAAGDLGFEVDTDAGPHRCVVRGEDIEVTMRAPSLAPGDVPVVAPSPVIDEAWAFDATTLRVTCVSMGNPHVVTFDAVEPAHRLQVGPRIERDPRFPRGVNVGFAHMAGPGVLDLHVWERGAGWTLACGTGASAAAVAAVETGRAARGVPLRVNLPGGGLTIVVGDRSEAVRMIGPARHVFDGVC